MLEFTREGGLIIYPHGDNNAIKIECSYTLTKEGLVKAKVKDIDAPEKVIDQVKNVISIGLEFEFNWKADGDKATLEGMEGKDVEHIKVALKGNMRRSETVGSIDRQAGPGCYATEKQVVTSVDGIVNDPTSLVDDP